MTQTTNAFHYSKKRNAVIIAPQGDALSYRDIDLQREGEEVRKRLEEDTVLRLAIDLGSSNYFGSIMIGMINSFGQVVKKAGGQMVLCNASEEMLAILKVMKIDTLWPHFPTQSKAIKILKAWKE